LYWRLGSFLSIEGHLAVVLDAQIHPLIQPARPLVVCRHVGQLALILALLFAVPTLFAAWSADWSLALALLLAALVPSLLLGICARLPSNERPLRPNEALVATVLAFILASVLMTVPLGSTGLPLPDAWFEAVSGITTTGLTMVPDPEARSCAFLFVRSWMQWVGGLGMVVLSLTLAVGRAADMHQLANAASLEEDPAESVRIHARRVLGVYLLLTAFGFALALASGLPVFEATVHTLSAISTGGFSGFSNNLTGLDRGIQIALLTVAFLGALPLPLFYRAAVHGARSFLGDLELRALAAAVAVTALLLWALGQVPPLDAVLQALSSQTGTGFSTLDVGALEPQAKWTLMLSMVAGAGIGSTAGGVKLLRVLILIRVLQLAILRLQVPRHAVIVPTLGGRDLDSRQIEHALLLLLLFPLVILASWLPFLAAGYDPLDSLLDVVSATATVGLSTGITSPELETGLKAVLTLDMLAGRVEILALLTLVYPGTWYKR
jgi:trk system potassium uptake protein TrkH